MKKQVSPVVTVIVILVVVVIVALLWNHFSGGAPVGSIPEKGMRRPPPSPGEIVKYAPQSAEAMKRAEQKGAEATAKLEEERRSRGVGVEKSEEEGGGQ